MDETYYTMKEVAERLKVHPNTVRSLIQRGKLQAGRVGRLVRIGESDVQRYLSTLPQHRYSIQEVADRLRVSPRTVGALIKKGYLHAVQERNSKMISEQELERFLASPPPYSKPGWPRKQNG